MKMRTFIQKKLWRDNAIERMEQMGSRINWRYLDDAEYDNELRSKLIEETAEVKTAKSRDELITELADVYEALDALQQLHGLTRDEVRAVQTKKRGERGGFEGRRFVETADHPVGGFGEKYCLADPEKYPEITNP